MKKKNKGTKIFKKKKKIWWINGRQPTIPNTTTEEPCPWDFLENNLNMKSLIKIFKSRGNFRNKLFSKKKFVQHSPSIVRLTRQRADRQINIKIKRG